MNKYKIAFALFLISFSTSLFAMQRGINGHVRGDVIAVQTDAQIAVYCDFTLQIVVTATNVLCVYNGVRVNTEDNNW